MGISDILLGKASSDISFKLILNSSKMHSKLSRFISTEQTQSESHRLEYDTRGGYRISDGHSAGKRNRKGKLTCSSNPMAKELVEAEQKEIILVLHSAFH